MSMSSIVKFIKDYFKDVFNFITGEIKGEPREVQWEYAGFY